MSELNCTSYSIKQQRNKIILESFHEYDDCDRENFVTPMASF